VESVKLPVRERPATPELLVEHGVERPSFALDDDASGSLASWRQ
jgi:hypothetical protein